MKRHNQLMTISRVAVALAIAACAPKTQPPNPNDVAPCEEPSDYACDRVACGANSPIVNTFPVSGLRPDGECNRDGTQLLPGTLNGGVNHACDGMTLGVRDNELVGMRGSAVGEACSGTKLAGASFVVRGWNKTNGKLDTLRVHIADVVPAYRGSADEVPRTAYRIVDDDNQSLCTANASTKARQTLGLLPLTGLTDPQEGHDLVIPVRSELYDAEGHAVPVDPQWKLNVPEWLHLACVDDALAKRSLHNLDTDDVTMSRAALSMFVADYCSNLHTTYRGAEIRWLLTDDPIAGAGSDLVEAKWDEKNAQCLSNPRALYEEAPGPQLPRNPVGDLASIASKCPECTTPDAWTARVRKCDIYLKRKPKVSPRPTCEDCIKGDCKGFGLWSYTIPKQATP